MNSPNQVFEYLHFPELDSTNQFAAQYASKTLPSDGFCVISDYQTAGRGQYGRKWMSERGKNLLATYIFDSSFLAPQNVFYLQFATSIAVWDCLHELGVPDLLIKWPNDLISQNQKICGILIQNILRGSTFQFSLIGVGINVNQTEFPTEIKACSVKERISKEIPLLYLAENLFHYLYKRMLEIKNNPIESLIAQYENHMYQIHQHAEFMDPNQNIIRGKILGVNPFGMIRLDIQNEERDYSFEELKMVW